MCAGEKEKICVYFGLSTVAAVASSVTEMLNKAIFARLSLSLCDETDAAASSSFGSPVSYWFIVWHT